MSSPYLSAALVDIDTEIESHHQSIADLQRARAVLERIWGAAPAERSRDKNDEPKPRTNERTNERTNARFDPGEQAAMSEDARP